MYLSYYHLAEKPFQISTDPRFLWYGEKHSEALANLRYGLMERNGYVVLTGDVGTGKTTLINALLASLNDKVVFASINHPKMETMEFMQFVARKFDPVVSATGKAELVSFFQTFLQKANARGKVVLLVVDEAQRLSLDLLEELRLLSNLEKAGQRLLNIILVGQNELKALLAAPQCRPLRQRITLFYEIQPLSLEETGEYVRHRLKVAGTTANLFSSHALREVHRFSQGRPRLINTICDRALLTGCLKERRIIDADIIAECAREMQFISPTAHLHRPTPLSIRGRSWIARHIRQPLHRTPSDQKHLKKASPAANTPGRWHQMVHSMIAGSTAFFQNNRRKIIPATLAAVIGFVYAILVVGLYPDASVETVEPIQAAQRAAKNIAGPSTGPVESPWQPPGKRAVVDEPAPGTAPAGASRSLSRDPAANLAPAPPKPSAVSPMHETNTATPPAKPAVAEANLPPVIEPDPLKLAAAALAQKDFQWAIELLEGRQSPQMSHHPEAANLYAEALVGRANQIMAQSPHQSEILLQKAVTVDPRYAPAYFSLGKFHMQNKAYKAAIDAYQRAAHLNPALPDAFFNLGFVYAATGGYEAAEKSFTQAARLKPAYLDKALFNLAMIQHKLGKQQAALASLEEAVAFRPQNQKARTYLRQFKAAEAGR